MHNITLKQSPLPIMGHGENDEFVQQNLPTWEDEVVEKLVRIGYPLELWPSEMKDKAGFIRYWKGTGNPRTIAPMDAPFDGNPYNGEKMHEAVMSTFTKSFPAIKNAFFCITRGENWWPFQKAFVCNDANSYMKYCLYLNSITGQKLLDLSQEKKAGRRAAKPHSEKNARYQQWLADCEAYRIRCAELKQDYMTALENYTAWKEQGAPKWIS